MFLYLFPCAYEDLVKLGFSRDPLARIRAFSPRYFEFFDLDRAVLLEGEAPRQARDWETALKRELRLLNAPAPLLVPGRAAGHTEWFRGGHEAIQQRMQAWASQGFPLHQPARDWLRGRLAAESDRLYGWSEAMLQALQQELQPAAQARALAQALRDACDAQLAMALPLEAHVSPQVLAWYRGDLP